MTAPFDLAPRIRAERERLGLTQTAAAARLGITKQSYSQLERPRCARGNPTVETLLALVAAGFDPRALVPELFRSRSGRRTAAETPPRSSAPPPAK